MGNIQSSSIRGVLTMHKKEKEAVEANQKMDDYFNDSDYRNIIGDSEADTANLKIQEQFYGNGNFGNSLPFHVDINNPPIKK